MTATTLDPRVAMVRTYTNGVLYLLIVHREGEMTEYDLGEEVEWQPDAGVAGRVASPWVTLTIRWWCSICSMHGDESDESCPACAAGTWETTRFAVWKKTGDVYRVGDDGAVGDDPWMRGDEIARRLAQGHA